MSAACQYQIAEILENMRRMESEILILREQNRLLRERYTDINDYVSALRNWVVDRLEPETEV